MFGGFGGFGASSAPAFGGGGGGFGQPAFGAPASTPAFGAPASTPAFGASSGFGAPAFGASSTPAFGASSTPAFGASSSPGLGGGLFGASASSAPAFGAPAPAFGAMTPAPSPAPFGAPASGGLFGGASTGGAFGAPTSTPAFGAFGASRPFGAAPAASSPFGTPAPASGTGLFGAPAPAPAAPFGTPAGAAGSAPGQGTRIAPFQKTVERDGTAPNTSTMANYMSITAMPQYVNKSVEELRFEDYQANVKTGSSAPAAQPFGQPAASSPFGAPAPASPFGGGSSLFGAASSPASSPFGGLATSTPAFGASTPPASSPFGGGTSLFGAPASAPAFGASSTPAFGGGGAFGAPSSAPAFGSGAPAFGTPGASSPFGASTGGGLFGSSAPAFGSQAPGSSPAPFSFGSSAPAFGSQQPSSTSAPAFGATPSLFGTPAPASGGGLFGASTAASNPFGATSSPAPAFGASSSAFGGFGSAFAKPGGTSAPFGASTGTSLFGASAAPSAFGSSAPSFGGGFGGFGGFGSTPASSSAPAFGGSSPSIFGGSTPSLFGGSTPSLFGGGSAPSFSTGGLFGTSNVGMPGSQPAGTQIGAQPQAQPPSVAAAPYGSFPALPTVPEPKVGISARPARTIQTTGTSHASPLLSLRGAAGPKLGVQVRSPHMSPLGSAMFGGPARAAPLARPGENGAAGAPQPPTPLPVRPNPHRLFIREPPPGTEPSASPSTSVGPAGAGAGASWLPPSTPIAMTPLPRSPEATPSFAPPTAASPSGLASPRSPAAAAATAAGAETGRSRELSFANGSSQRHALADFTREATPEEDGGSAAVREALPTLGRLASEGYTYEPSPTQLVAMHTLDPRSLHKVHNFTITRAGIGSIRWLRPVDVVGLKLDNIVTIQQGEVFCYSDAEKPPLGQGLNLDAEITLYGVHKTDRATGAPVRDGPQLVKWEKSLRLMCLRMGAKFVTYKPDGGVWRFEVEHFSRYGLLPEVEAEVEDLGITGTPGPDIAGPGFGGTPASRTLHPSLARTPWGADRQPRFGTMMGMEEDEDEEVSLAPRGRGIEARQADQDEAQGPRADSAYARGGTPLQHGLPAGLNLSPASLLALRDSFGTGSSSFGGGRGGLSPSIEVQLGLPNKRAKPTLLAQPLTAAGTEEAPVPRSREAAVPAAYAASAAAGEGAPVVHSWRRAAAPLARPFHKGPSTPAPPTAQYHQGALARTSGGGGDVDGGTLEGGGGRLAARAMGVIWGEEEAHDVGTGAAGRAEAAGGPGWADSGLMMARSFRASWGPGGMLVVPGRGIITSSGSSHPLTLLHVSPCGPAPSSTQQAPPPPLSRPDPLGLIEHSGAEPASQAATDMDEAEAPATGEDAKEDQRQGSGPAALQRARLAAALEVHLQHSAPLRKNGHSGNGRIEEAAGQEGTDGLSEDVPRWQLRCTRESLKDFVGAITVALRRTLILPFGELSEQQQQEQQQQQPEEAKNKQGISVASSSSGGVPPCKDWGSILQQAGLSGLSLTRHLPPCIFMGSQADFMVPYTSGKQMADCLERCGVPTQQLHYKDIAHSQFVTVWPLLTAEQLEACSSQDKIGVPASDLETKLEGLPNYACDLVRVLQGKY
mmetsp:Transcript_10635/g.29106  ORF Transcript_10635/g.29106 Transcript_10635/m.29106 type:complete len:1605 (-) Transcript_10635:206-5020(-)